MTEGVCDTGNVLNNDNESRARSSNQNKMQIRPTRMKSPKPKRGDGITPGQASKLVPDTHDTTSNTSKLSLSKHKQTNNTANMSIATKPLRLRIVLLGAERSGKSCLIKRYCEKRFVSKYMPTIGIDYGATKIYVDKCEVSVHIFDTSGSPLFTDVRNEFYYDAHGILIVFDVTKRETFESLGGWIHEIRTELQRRSMSQPGRNETHKNCNTMFSDSSPVVLVCGNKVDLLETKEYENQSKHNCVDEVEARLWADVHGFQFCETSASTGVGVGDMFHAFFSTIVKQQLHLMTNGGKLPKTPASARRVQIGSTNSSGTTSPESASKCVESRSNEQNGPSVDEVRQPTTEQDNVMKRLQTGKDAWSQLGLKRGCSKDDVNKVYRKLAVLLHPDKTGVKGADEAFKLLCFARKNIMVTLDTLDNIGNIMDSLSGGNSH